MSTVINHNGTANPEALTIDIITSQYAGSAENVYIPEGVKTIEEYAFVSSSLNNVTIPSTVSSIVSGAFIGCYRLHTINIDKNNQNTTFDK